MLSQKSRLCINSVYSLTHFSYFFKHTYQSKVCIKTGKARKVMQQMVTNGYIQGMEMDDKREISPLSFLVL